jgi:hypothetical protein
LNLKLDENILSSAIIEFDTQNWDSLT